MATRLERLRQLLDEILVNPGKLEGCFSEQPGWWESESALVNEYSHGVKLWECQSPKVAEVWCLANQESKTKRWSAKVFLVGVAVEEIVAADAELLWKLGCQPQDVLNTIRHAAEVASGPARQRYVATIGTIAVAADRLARDVSQQIVNSVELAYDAVDGLSVGTKLRVNWLFRQKGDTKEILKDKQSRCDRAREEVRLLAASGVLKILEERGADLCPPWGSGKWIIQVEEGFDPRVFASTAGPGIYSIWSGKAIDAKWTDETSLE